MKQFHRTQETNALH